MPAKLLCIGDIHLGRVPSKLPDTIGPIKNYSPAAAFSAAVEWAKNHHVDALLMAGDVLESEESRFEELPILAKGIKSLYDAGIPSYAVAGNHDSEALPRLKNIVNSLHIIGADGKWEETVIEGADGTNATILGWSFPCGCRGAYRENPLKLLDPSFSANSAIGLLHADLDAPGSRYAPVTRAELDSVPVAGWLLGHIHKPDALDEMQRPIGYMGSLCGLDPGEPGMHSAWLVEISPGGALEMKRIPLAPIRWETIEIDAAELDAETMNDVSDMIIAGVRGAMDAKYREIEPELENVKAVGCRIRITGRNAAAQFIRTAAADPGILAALTSEYSGISFFTEKIICTIRPALDVESLAKGDDAAGILARRILILEEGGRRSADMICEARRKITDQLNRKLRRDAEVMIQDDGDMLRYLLEGAYDALDALCRDSAGTGGIK